MQNNYNNLLEDVKVKVHALQAIKHQDWQLEINKDGYQVYIKENPENGLNINRIETEAKVNPEELIQVLGDFNKRKEFDENFVDGKVLEEIDENTKIIYQQGKSPAVLIEARDFVMIVRKIKVDNGFLLLSRSVEHPAAPSAKGFTRAEIIFNAWFLTVQPNGLTKIVVISHIDAKGDVPKAFINQGYKKQAENVKKVLQYIAKH